jgi:hypothetical protein
MSTRYEYARSGREKSLLLVFPEGTFEGLPFEVRLAAPWVGHGYGDISALKPADRWHFHQTGYAILREAQSEQEVSAGDETPASVIADNDALRQAA